MGTKTDLEEVGGGAVDAFFKRTLKRTDRLIGKSHGSCCGEIQAMYKEES